MLFWKKSKSGKKFCFLPFFKKWITHFFSSKILLKFLWKNSEKIEKVKFYHFQNFVIQKNIFQFFSFFFFSLFLMWKNVEFSTILKLFLKIKNQKKLNEKHILNLIKKSSKSNEKNSTDTSLLILYSFIIHL